MKNKKKKSPLILEKASGKLPKYNKTDDPLLVLNSKIKKKIQELKE
ncbi:hypothetical protein [Heyndrickxia acidicola]|uniref:Uncharacterized protein n=1 Tax=Heyndrickxia acidicola TaxID=209389 RepID=A0ABU6MAW0_9BACI|nr:hypothetical protein [Heyndrickxia acidicola]MED1201532.1 hypothetical protein [Heyndrickxia acidicola]